MIINTVNNSDSGNTMVKCKVLLRIMYNSELRNYMNQLVVVIVLEFKIEFWSNNLLTKNLR